MQRKYSKLYYMIACCLILSIVISSSHQPSFMKAHSTSTNLLEFTLFTATVNKADIVCRDFRKAFFSTKKTFVWGFPKSLAKHMASDLKAVCVGTIYTDFLLLMSIQ